MAVGKQPAAAVDCQAQAKPAKKRRFVVARRTTPTVIKKPAAFATTADYEVDTTSSLGECAFGVVYKARHHATGQTVAIKFDAYADGDPRELLREARFLEACSGNSHVVGFRCVVRDPPTGELGLVMEFVPGPSLRNILFQRRRAAKPPFPEATVRAFMRQLQMGASGMQDRNIVHRDIKPENVMVTEEGGEVLLKICDFGLAISASDPPPHKQAGTKMYIAPEVLMGKPDPDALVDAWSLGCVMAELLVGERLLQRGGLMEALFDMEMCAEEIAYLWTIFGVLGTPDDTTWPGFASLPRAATMPLELGQRSARCFRGRCCPRKGSRS
uniref:Uncharacterized protein n=3 Tax=Avena sativa TaxID=4498 RepID=A0ACD5YZ14_AVESA